MKKLAIVFVLFFWLGIMGQDVWAQAGEGFRLGFQINQVQSDFGLGLNMSIPLFGQRLTLRAAGSQQWLEVYRDTGAEWVGYQTLRLGATGAWMISESIRTYGEGGTMAVFPNASFSSSDPIFGGYGLFGFEFLPMEGSSSALFIEIGGTTSGGNADLAPNGPVFGAGLLLSSGFRYGFAGSGKKEGR